MHAAIPRLFPAIHQALKLGLTHGVNSQESDKRRGLDKLARFGALATQDKPGNIDLGLDRAVGSFVAEAMALLLECSFGLIMLGDEIEHGTKAKFFEENFVFRDPNAPGGKRYYQGIFLITTRDPNEDMNVLLEFCPNPLSLADETPAASAVVRARAVSKQEAEVLKTTPFAIDLLIQFRDLSAIFGLIGTANLDMVSLMLQNKVQMKGNTGHLFKLGAISASVQAAAGMKPQ
ncbi:MAG TPA: hypothetical protein VIU46_00490 [Gallionellaceae bacterium]